MLTNTYLILKSLHLISIVAWMAGILYLFRLFVYHTEEPVKVVKERFQIMEWRLYHYITLPAMIASLVFGVGLIALEPSLLMAQWLHPKLLLVAILVAVTVFAGYQIAELAAGTCQISARMFRILNEIPTLLLIGIVFLVVLKPFG